MASSENYYDYLKANAVDTGEIEGHEYFIVLAPSEGSLNGYLVFNKRPTREESYDGILSYVPVHGGITLASKQKDGKMIYGFDTLHYNSKEFPRFDKNWIKEQITIMLHAILIAAKVEGKYLKCISNKGKAKYCQMVEDVAPQNERSMGAMLNVLSGKL